jgi:hypothetical protein
MAERRHPRAGTGTGGYGYFYGPRYGGYHRPYYGGYYRPYYRPYFYGSLYFGWPYYSLWPYYSGGYDYYPGYYLGYYAPSYRYYSDEPRGEPTPDADRSYDSDRDSGRVRLEVRPDDASVYVDDEFWGTAGETKFLTLRSGRHMIELVRPGFRTERREVEVVRGEIRDVLVEMQRP